jgi:hypothetical protein
MTENDHTSWEDRLLAASPRGVRSLAADIPRRPPTTGSTPAAPAEPSPGLSDGGTSTTPRPTVSLEHEMDGAKVREAAAKLRRTR